MSAPTAPGPAYSESSPSTGLPMSNGEPGPWVLALRVRLFLTFAPLFAGDPSYAPKSHRRDRPGRSEASRIAPGPHTRPCGVRHLVACERRGLTPAGSTGG